MEEKKTDLTVQQEEQNRLRSWAMWTTLFAAVWIILRTFGVTEVLGVGQEGWATVLDAIGSVLMVFGIVNNPNHSGKL